MHTCIKIRTRCLYIINFCWSFLIQVLFKFFRLFAFIRAAFIAYLQGLILLSRNTFHLNSLSSLTPFVMRLTCYLCSIYYISPSHLTWNAIMWLPRDCTEPTYRTLGTRLTPKSLAWMSYHVTTLDMSHAGVCWDRRWFIQGKRGLLLYLLETGCEGNTDDEATTKRYPRR